MIETTFPLLGPAVADLIDSVVELPSGTRDNLRRGLLDGTARAAADGTPWAGFLAACARVVEAVEVDGDLP